jgi:hypothetical protein
VVLRDGPGPPLRPPRARPGAAQDRRSAGAPRDLEQQDQERAPAAPTAWLLPGRGAPGPGRRGGRAPRRQARAGY